MKTILIVEDDKHIVKMLTRRLKKEAYELHYAENGKIGVEKAMALQPDLVLMDMHMPVMDGIEATALLRSQGYKGLISALTASVSILDSKKSIDAGCDHFHSKPIGPGFEDDIRFMLEEER